MAQSSVSLKPEQMSQVFPSVIKRQSFQEHLETKTIKGLSTGRMAFKLYLPKI